MSKEVYVMVPVKVIVNKSDEVIGISQPVDLDDCELSYKQFGSYCQKHLIIAQLKVLFEFEASQCVNQKIQIDENYLKDKKREEFYRAMSELGTKLLEEKVEEKPKQKKKPSIKLQTHTKAKK